MLVVLPLAALTWASTQDGATGFWDAVSSPQAVAALKLTLGASLVVSFANAVLGTVTAWVLVRDDFRGKSLMNALIDLPFALPTIVAGLVLLALYGPRSPIGIDVAYTRTAIVLALMFVTLPFVVRTVQPVLQELDAEMEEAARSLGASHWTTFRRVIFPNILPGILSGVALAFAKAVGEFGSLVIITGNLPVQDRGLVRLHLRPHRERRRERRRRRGRRAARASRSGSCSRSARSATTRRGTTVPRLRLAPVGETVFPPRAPFFERPDFRGTSRFPWDPSPLMSRRPAHECA